LDLLGRPWPQRRTSDSILGMSNSEVMIDTEELYQEMRA